MYNIENSWLNILVDEFNKDYFRELTKFINDEYDRGVVYPVKENIFKAFELTELNNVKVVILGQDPYHNVNQAHGLSFSVLPSQSVLPPSLINIFKEIQDDVGGYIPNNGYLEKWAKKGYYFLILF